MAHLEAVIFDMDGVLVDSERLYMLSEQMVLKDYGVEVDPFYFRKFCGTTQDFIWSNVLEEFSLNVPLDEIKEAGRKKLDEVFTTQELPLISGVLDLLKELEYSKIPLAVASSSSKFLIETHLNTLKIADYFESYHSGEEVKQSKPEPDVFLKAAKELSVDPQNCLVIEDSRNGVLAAKAAGMKCIGFNNEAFPPLDLSEADKIVTSLNDITIDVMKSLFN